MPPASFEIRVCMSCGLRYPRVDTDPPTTGMRCPDCLGETRLERRVDRAPADRRMGEARGGGTRSPGPGQFAVLLDNVRSAWNVGSILRSADGFGFAHAYLCGITPRADNDAVRKTALGAEVSVPWTHHKDAVHLVDQLRAEGWAILALEDSDRAVELTRFGGITSPAVLIVGSEVSGVDPGLLERCDFVLHIPMRGSKNSFNVSVAFSIAAYELGK